jgi:hypothetical protein
VNSASTGDANKATGYNFANLPATTSRGFKMSNVDTAPADGPELEFEEAAAFCASNVRSWKNKL